MDTRGSSRQQTNPMMPEASDAPRSGYGSVPGSEFSAGVYRTVIIAYAWMLFAAWFAFGASGEADLILTIGTVLAVVFFALPIIIRRMTAATSSSPREISESVETATGRLSRRDASFQVLMLPLVLAAAAVLFGAAFLMSHA